MKPVAFALLVIEIKETIIISLFFKSPNWTPNTPTTEYVSPNGILVWSTDILVDDGEDYSIANQIKAFEYKHLFTRGSTDSSFNFI